MHLEKLQLLNFKNYEEAMLTFPAKVNCFLGLNGSGKTNLLDAIHYLSATKSFLNSSDAQNIRHGTELAVIKGNFRFDKDAHEVSCQLQRGHKKLFREDSNDYNKLSEHIGKYPVVLISPTDVDLVREGSEARRKFFDNLISQIDHTYLEWLVEYHRVLKQRNSLLSLLVEQNYRDEDLVDSYDQQLAKTGQKIFNKRLEFIREFQPVFNSSYSVLVDQKEEADLLYKSEVGNYDYLLALKQNFQKDLFLERTNFGIHRDDYDFVFSHGELKKLGSQGQQKSFLVAIKLAQVEVVKAHKGFNPILLLDDVFDKLDDVRIARLLQVISAGSYGQLFITDAGSERTKALFKGLRIQFDVFNVVEGTVTL